MSDTTGPLTRQFTPEQIETALSTLADLYENSGDDTGDYLSEKQQEIAELVRHAKADIDNADSRDPGDRVANNEPADSTMSTDDVDGEGGHCDTCGTPCDLSGCTRDRSHVIAIG